MAAAAVVNDPRVYVHVCAFPCPLLQVVEGSAGTGVAAALRLADDLVGCTVVVVCCGSNISVDKLRKLLAPASA